MEQPGTQTRTPLFSSPLPLQIDGITFFVQVIESLFIAEEVGDANQEFFEKYVYFVRVCLKIAQIIGQVGDLMDRHPAFDAPDNSALFVIGEVMARFWSGS